MRTARLLAPRLRRRVGGFTLLELLISVTIGLVILAASLSLYVASSRASQTSQLETQMNEDGILAINLIQQQLKQAGYSRQIIPAAGATVMGNFAGPAVRGCDAGFANDGVAFASLTCATPTSTGPHSSAIAIRYEATSDNTYPTTDAPPKATNCVGNGIDATTPSQAIPAPTPAPAPFALADNRYSVTDATTEPMLSCRGSTGSAIGGAQPLLANVESMRILYGVASRPSAELAAHYDPMRHQIVAYLDASGVNALPPSTTPLPTLAEDQWGRVLSVRVCLLMRSDQPVRDVPPGGMTYKDCSNIDQTGTDGYLRRTYTTTVLLRNRVIVP